MSGGSTGLLEQVLGEARDAGALGPGPIDVHVRHAEAFGALAERLLGGPPISVLDLGSGAGVPGLVLALRWPSASIVLLDGSARRCGRLRDAVARVGLGARCTVLEGRGEELGRDPALRGGFALVVARSFGPPAVTAEIGGPFLDARGLLVVSEPPAGDLGRWDARGLRALGLGPAVAATSEGFRFVSIRRVAPSGARWPRRVGIPAKRPLW